MAQPVKSLSFMCPHCTGPAKVRTSKQVTRTVKDAWVVCQAVMCGHTFKAQLVVVATISPAAQPHPSVHLPIAVRPFQADMVAPDEVKRVHRKLPPPLPANDESANDDAPPAQIEVG